MQNNHIFIIYFFYQKYNHDHIIIYILGASHHTFILYKKEEMLPLRFETQFIENFLPNGTKFSIGICIQILYAWIPPTKRNPGIRLILHHSAVIPA